MHRSWLTHALAATSIMFLAVGCGSATANTSTASKQTDITVGVVPTEGFGGLYIAQDQGYFRQHGLHVTIKTVVSANAALPALLHGSIDVLASQYSTFIQAEAAGAGQFKILGPGWSLGPHVEAVVVPPKSPIQTVRGLSGKTIAVNAIGGIDQILTDGMITSYSMKPAEVHYVAIPFQGIGAALAAHRVDAGYLAEPYLTEAVEKYGDQILADPDQGAAQDLPLAGYMATKTWVEQNTAVAIQFAAAIAQGNTQAITNPGLFQKAMEDQLHISPMVVAVMATGSFSTGISEVQLQRVADVMYEFGALKKPFSVKGMLL
jgi:NitT/TauT family transport system substrate-binding protein